MPTTTQPPVPVHVHHHPVVIKPVNNNRITLTHEQFHKKFPDYSQILMGFAHKIKQEPDGISIATTDVGDWWFARGFQAYHLGAGKQECPLPEYGLNALGMIGRTNWLEGWDTGADC